MATLLGNRIPRPNSVHVAKLVQWIGDDLGDATGEIYTLQSRLHIVRLKVGVAKSRLETLRQILARPSTRNGHARRAAR